MKNLLTLLLLIVCLPAWGQRFVEELPTIASLKARNVHGINKSIYVRGYLTEGDGGGGTFIVTNTAIGADNVFRIASTQSAGWAYDRLFSGPADIRWAGATGNGATDDSVAVQTLLNAAANKGYGTYVSKGQYKITQPIGVPSNTRMSGDGPTSEFILSGTDDAFFASGNTNIFISGLKFSGSYGRAIVLLSGKTFTVQNCEFTGATRQPASGYLTPIRIDNSSSAKILNNYFHGNGNGNTNFDASVELLIGGGSSETRDVEISGNRLEGLLTRVGIATFSMVDGRILNNFVDQGNTLGPLQNNGYGILVYGIPGNTYRNVVAANQITNCAGTGIYIRSGNGVVVDRNSVTDSGKQQSDVSLPVGGIVINISYGAQVLGNGITNATKAGINITDSTNVVTSGNIIQTVPNRPAIEVRGILDNGSIADNIMSTVLRGIGSTIGAGIFKNVQMHNNSISNATDGVYIETGTNNMINMNQFQKIVNIGINNAAGSNAVIALNIMANVGGIGVGIKNDARYSTISQNLMTGFLTKYNNTDTNTTIIEGPTGARGLNLIGNTRMEGAENGTQYALEVLRQTYSTNQYILQLGSIGAPINAFSLTTDSSSNFVFQFNGITYRYPSTQGLAGQTMVNDGSGGLTWGGTASSFNFGNQFDVQNNTNINLATGLSTTNQNLAGGVTAGTINLGSVNGAITVDANSAPEFNMLLSGDSTITFTNWPDYHNVNLSLTNAGNFSLTFADTMYWMETGNATQQTNDWGAGIYNTFSIWKTGGRLMASKKGLTILSSGAVGANPTALVGLTTVNGASGFFIRSDAAPAIDQTIAPNWTGIHTFQQNLNSFATPVKLKNTNAVNGVNTGIDLPFYLRDDSGSEYQAISLRASKAQDWAGAGTANSQASLNVLSAGVVLPAFSVSALGSYYQHLGTIGATDPFLAGNWFQFRSSETATAGAQKYSPALTLQGSGWNPTSVAAVNVQVGQYVIPVQEAAGTPSSRWLLEAQTTNSPTGTAILEVTSKSSVILGERLGLQTNATDGFTYMPSGLGTPLGTPASVTGKIPFYYDSANNIIYMYNGGWLAFAQSAAGANWIASGTSNAFLNGNATASKYISTNGYAFPSGSILTTSAFSGINAGGAVTIVNNSSASGSHLDLKGGTGSESYIDLYGGNARAISITTNKVLQSLSGRAIFRFATSTNYTITVTNHYVAATATCTNTLAAASSFLNGQVIIVKNVAGTTTVRPTGGDTIDGVAADDSLTAKAAHRYMSDGVSNWELF